MENGEHGPEDIVSTEGISDLESVIDLLKDGLLASYDYKIFPSVDGSVVWSAWDGVLDGSYSHKPPKFSIQVYVLDSQVWHGRLAQEIYLCLLDKVLLARLTFRVDVHPPNLQISTIEACMEHYIRDKEFRRNNSDALPIFEDYTTFKRCYCNALIVIGVKNWLEEPAQLVLFNAAEKEKSIGAGPQEVPIVSLPQNQILSARLAVTSEDSLPSIFSEIAHELRDTDSSVEGRGSESGHESERSKGSGKSIGGYPPRARNEPPGRKDFNTFDQSEVISYWGHIDDPYPPSFSIQLYLIGPDVWTPDFPERFFQEIEKDYELLYPLRIDIHPPNPTITTLDQCMDHFIKDKLFRLEKGMNKPFNIWEDYTVLSSPYKNAIIVADSPDWRNDTLIFAYFEAARVWPQHLLRRFPNQKDDLSLLKGPDVVSHRAVLKSGDWTFDSITKRISYLSEACNYSGEGVFY